jgi:DNA-binding transcriptional MocR family regulator
MLSPDFRVGWNLAGRHSGKARALKFISTLCSPCHTQFALARFLETRQLDRHLGWVAPLYMKKQQAMINAINRWFPESTQVSHPRGGFLSWIKLPDEIDGLTLYRDAISAGITLTPGEICSPTGRYKNYIRLNYGVVSAEEMDWAVKILGGLINGQGRAHGETWRQC